MGGHGVGWLPGGLCLPARGWGVPRVGVGWVAWWGATGRVLPGGVGMAWWGGYSTVLVLHSGMDLVRYVLPCLEPVAVSVVLCADGAQLVPRVSMCVPLCMYPGRVH